MSDETRMTLLHSSTNDLIEELLMWRGRAYKLLDRIAELERLVETYTTSNGLRNRVLQDIVEKQTKHIAELEEFKMIVEGCGFEVITEPPVLNHPERKILKGHGTIYVPELPEPPEVK